MEQFGSRLKRLRQEKQLSTKQMSLMTGIPISTYREWEAGRQVLGQPYVKLAQALEVNVYELLTGERMDRFEGHELIEKIEKDLSRLKQILQSLE